MEVVRLEPGMLAPLESDFIRIDPLMSGRSSLLGGSITPDEIISLGHHESSAAAEEVGFQWAASRGVHLLYVETWYA